jgi:SAM-dependent methyltransferase
VKTLLHRINFDIEFRHWWFRSRRRILCDLVRDVLPPSKNALVAEIGCGTGGTIGVLGQDYRCIGVEPSAEAIALARGRFPDIQYVCGFAPEAVRPLASGVRVFLLADVLEHVADDRGLLAALVDMAAPGAYFLITVPADMSLWSSHDEVHGHCRRYDAATLAALWRGLPVDAQLLSHFNSRLYPLIKAVRRARRWLRGTWGPAQTDLTMPVRPVNRLLECLFTGEGRVLREARCGKGSGYPRGASLVALLQKRTQAAAAQGAPRRAA